MNDRWNPYSYDLDYLAYLRRMFPDGFPQTPIATGFPGMPNAAAPLPGTLHGPDPRSGIINPVWDGRPATVTKPVYDPSDPPALIYTAAPGPQASSAPPFSAPPPSTPVPDIATFFPWLAPPPRGPAQPDPYDSDGVLSGVPVLGLDDDPELDRLVGPPPKPPAAYLPAWMSGAQWTGGAAAPSPSMPATPVPFVSQFASGFDPYNTRDPYRAFDGLLDSAPASEGYDDPNLEYFVGRPQPSPYDGWQTGALGQFPEPEPAWPTPYGSSRSDASPPASTPRPRSPLFLDDHDETIEDRIEKALEERLIKDVQDRLEQNRIAYSYLPPHLKSIISPEAFSKPRHFDPKDIAFSAGVKFGEGLISSAGLPGEIQSLVRQWRDAGLEGKPQEYQDFVRRFDQHGRLPTSSEIKGAIEQHTGPFYQPQTLWGDYAGTAGGLAGSLAGPGGVPAKVARWVGSTLLSETAGQLTKGTELEPWARMLGEAAAGRVGGASSATDAGPVLWARSNKGGAKGAPPTTAPPPAGDLPGLVSGRAPPAGNTFYVVAYRAELPPELHTRSSRKHKHAANEMLLRDMKSDPKFAEAMEKLGIVLKRGPLLGVPRKAPENWVWHHVIGEPGVLYLTPIWMHEDPQYRQSYHFLPGRAGGRSQWGGKR